MWSILNSCRLLGDRNERGDVVTGMGILSGQKRVVEIKLAHRDTVGPGRPFRRIAAVNAEDPRTLARAVGQRLLTGHRDRSAQHRSGADAGVVNDPVEHHLRGRGLDGNRIGGDFCDLCGQVLAAWEIVGAAPHPDPVHQHNPHTMQRGSIGKDPAYAYLCVLTRRVLQTLRT